MILTAHTTAPDATTCAYNESARPPLVIESSALDFGTSVEISLGRSHFSFGEQHLSLEKPLRADAYLNTGLIRIKDWDIQYPMGRTDFNLDRELVRKFLTLFSRAETNSLSSYEAEEWAKIVAQVDYQRFCADRSPHVYMEGTLLENTAAGWRVRWHDGSEQWVKGQAGTPLNVLDEGQGFAALVKFGREKAVLSIDNISFVSTPNTTGEALWQSWPTVNS